MLSLVHTHELNRKGDIANIQDIGIVYTYPHLGVNSMGRLLGLTYHYDHKKMFYPALCNGGMKHILQTRHTLL